MSLTRVAALLTCLGLTLVTPHPASSQPNEGTIAGIVRDATGASLPGAAVTVTNQQTRASRTATSSADGSYTVSGLTPGLYTVTAEFAGFGRTTQTDVNVTVGQTTTTELTLQARVEELVTVTGTRVAGRTALETPAPVDIIDSAAIRNTGATETGKILQLLAPSVNFSTTFISDGTDAVRPATLRGLGPDQTLLLVNGRRRQQTALIHIQQTVARGTAGYDVNTIPASAIERIEVLRDGASAQYGSDAIAGVVNFVLKRKTGTELTFEGGQHFDENPDLPLGASPDAQGGHGRRFMAGINTGFKVGRDGIVNFTAEYRDRGETNRAVADILRVDPPRVIQRIGDPKARDLATFVNAEIPAGPEGGSFYAFGGYSWRKSNSSGFFRSKGDGRTVPDLYPEGFLPTIITTPIDASATAGYRGGLGRSPWRYDVGANYGMSEFGFREENTVNVSYFYEPRNRNDPTGPRFRESPTEGDTGTLRYDQLGLNLDFVGTVRPNRLAGLNVALGAEWRREGYTIEPGDPVSYQYGRNNDRTIQILNQNGGTSLPGTQGFPGFDPTVAVDESRTNVALYADVESQLTKKFLAAAAARYEHYSDFGNTITGKIAARANFSPQFSLRGTVSTGFRAPGVQQKFFSLRSTNLNAAGVLTDTLTARQDSAVTRDFGIPPLKEETSRNYSAGVVLRPADRLRFTVDLYRIDIDDRIVFSSNVQPEDPATCGTPFNAARCPIAAILERYVPGGGQVQFFTNAIDTRTAGLDIVALYDWMLPRDATLALEAAFHRNDTDVTARRSASSILPPALLFDQAQVTLVEEGQPRQRLVLSGTYANPGGWTANVRLNYFGEVSGEGFTPGFKQTWKGDWLTDVQFTVPLQRDRLTLTVGAQNVFNVYPDEWDPVRAFPFPQLGFRYGWETLPFGINGGYYFARLNVRLNRATR